MLVLSRQKDETVIIGDDIQITVVDIKGDKVRLGITAPKSISVHRLEIWLAVKNGTTDTLPGNGAKLEQDYQELDAGSFIPCPGCGARVAVHKSADGIEYIASHYVAKDVHKDVCVRSATAIEHDVDRPSFERQSAAALNI